MKRKSQLQMGETIAILIIFFIFVAFGLIFYARIMGSGAEAKKMESTQLLAVQVAQRASFLPELQCSEENIRRDNCIDILKIDAAAGIIKNNKLDYYDTFGFSNISIREIFPDTVTHFGDDNTVILYEEVPDQFFDKKVTFIPIALSDYKERAYYFGIMKVEVYVK